MKGRTAWILLAVVVLLTAALEAAGGAIGVEVPLMSSLILSSSLITVIHLAMLPFQN